MNTTKQKPKVLIVGAGPTGMMAAVELSRMGIPLRIVEKAPQPATTSRAIGVQARTLELFAQRGLVQPMLDKGNRGVGGSIYGEGKRIFRLDFSHNGSEYGYLLLISQAETEAVLRSALERQGVTVERAVELVAFSQPEHGESVTAILKHGDGSLEEVKPDYVIDTEGAHSIGRTTLDLQFAGKTLVEDYALGDLFVDGNLPESDLHIFSSSHGFLAMFPLGGKRFRLIASNPLSRPSKDTAPSLDELQTIYDQRSHIAARFHDLEWSSWFRINSRMVDRLRVGRIFLGGDTAHIHSPAGAQGMNTGLQDMINLCWKLAFVIHGKADRRLLDTYNDDRLPVIKSVLSKTEGLTDAIGSENPVVRSVFAHIAPWLVGTEFVQENSTERMSQLSLNYRESPLSISHHAVGGLRGGDRVPNVPVQLTGGQGSGGREPVAEHVFGLLSSDRFTLLFANLKTPEAPNHSAQTSLAQWKSVMDTYTITARPGSEKAFKSVFGAEPSLMLVRPDGYAAFVGAENAVDSLAQYLAEWLPVQVPAREEAYA